MINLTIKPKHYKQQQQHPTLPSFRVANFTKSLRVTDRPKSREVLGARRASGTKAS